MDLDPPALSRSLIANELDGLSAPLRRYIEPHLLSRAEIRALRDPRQSITPAETVGFESLEDFKANSNNFHGIFTREPDSASGLYFRTVKAFHRFRELHPETSQRLAEEGRTYGGPDEFPDTYWQDLYEAYNTMAKLVDVNDANSDPQVLLG